MFLSCFPHHRLKTALTQIMNIYYHLPQQNCILMFKLYTRLLRKAEKNISHLLCGPVGTDCHQLISVNDYIKTVYGT